MRTQVWNGSAWVDVNDLHAWDGSAWQSLVTARRWNGASWVIFWTKANPNLNWSGLEDLGPSQADSSSVQTVSGLGDGESITLGFYTDGGDWTGSITAKIGVTSQGTITSGQTSTFTVQNGNAISFDYTSGGLASGVETIYSEALHVVNMTYYPAYIIKTWVLKGYT